MSASDIAQARESMLCREYWRTRNHAVRAEFLKRGTFTEQELEVIDAGTVAIGHRPIAVMCARGLPKNITRSASSDGERMVYLYDDLSVSFSTEGTVEHITERH